MSAHRFSITQLYSYLFCHFFIYFTSMAEMRYRRQKKCFSIFSPLCAGGFHDKVLTNRHTQTRVNYPYKYFFPAGIEVATSTAVVDSKAHT